MARLRTEIKIFFALAPAKWFCSPLGTTCCASTAVRIQDKTPVPHEASTPMPSDPASHHPPRDPATKSAIRLLGQAARRQQPEKLAASRRIFERLVALPGFGDRRTILFYLDARDEVRTQFALADQLARPVRVVIPWCTSTGELGLFWLRDLSELSPGAFGILEPRSELRLSPERRVQPSEVDLVLVPGVAFDESGGRLGHGQGYYDKLLAGVRPQCHRVGLAFESQIVPHVPREPHDIPMHDILTERRSIRCQVVPSEPRD